MSLKKKKTSKSYKIYESELNFDEIYDFIIIEYVFFYTLMITIAKEPTKWNFYSDIS